MARSKPARSAGSQGWRNLSQLDRFSVLLNHFGGALALSEASGIPARSLRSVFTTAVEGRYVRDEDGSYYREVKSSRVIESARWVEGLRKARHRMTDQLRRTEIKAVQGAFTAPVARTPTNLIPPQQLHAEMLLRDSAGQVRKVQSKSDWHFYDVEFLSDAEIKDIIESLHNVFMDTGQFNFMRYEYLLVGEIYSGGQFKDYQLEEASEEYELIKMSSSYFPFQEQPFSGAYANWVMDDWNEKQLRGAVRITGLYFTLRSEGGQPWADARAAFRRSQKRKRANGGKKKRGI